MADEQQAASQPAPIRFGTQTYLALADHHAFTVEALSNELAFMTANRDHYRAFHDKYVGELEQAMRIKPEWERLQVDNRGLIDQIKLLQERDTGQRTEIDNLRKTVDRLMSKSGKRHAKVAQNGTVATKEKP